MILGAGMLTHVLNFAHSLVAGRRAPANPWGGLTLEWYAESPPIEHNFHHEPMLKHGPYDYEDVVPPHCDPKDFPLPEPLPAGARGH